MIPLPCYEILHQASLDWKPANVYREEPAVWQQPDRQFHTKTFQIHNKFFIEPTKLKTWCCSIKTHTCNFFSYSKSDKTSVQMRSTYNNIAVRLDAIDPESIVNQRPSAAKQFLQLTDGVGSHQTSHVDHVALWPSCRRWRPRTNSDWIFRSDWHRPHWFGRLVWYRTSHFCYFD